MNLKEPKLIQITVLLLLQFISQLNGQKLNETQDSTMTKLKKSIREAIAPLTPKYGHGGSRGRNPDYSIYVKTLPASYPPKVTPPVMPKPTFFTIGVSTKSPKPPSSATTNLPATKHEERHDHHKEEKSGNSTYDYKGVHKDWDGVIDPTDFIRHSEDRKDICAKCLCTRDLSKVSCEHDEYQTDMVHISRSLIPSETRQVKVIGYNQVRVEAGAFASESTNLSVVIFQGIKDLQLEKNSLNIAENSWKNNELTLKFINCNMTTFPTGVLTQRLMGVHGRHARTNLKGKMFLSVVFHRCHIESIQEFAMTNSRLIYLNMTSSVIKRIEHKGIDLNVYELSLFKNNNFPTLREEAICLHAKKVVFTGNYFEDIGNHSIAIETDSQVLFEFNKVRVLQEEALKGIHPISKYGSNIVFHRNIVYEAKPRSLVIDQTFPLHERKVFNNTFYIECNCTIDQYFHAIMGTDPDGADFGDSFQILLRRTRCLRPTTGDLVTVKAFLEGSCAPFPIVVVASVSIAFFLFIVAMAVCVICSLRMQHLRDEARSLGECTSQSFSTLSRQWPQRENDSTPRSNPGTLSPIWIQTGGTAFPFALAVPEVRTYQQNEVNEFTEWTESIRGSTVGTLELLGKKGNIGNRASCPVNLETQKNRNLY